MPIPDQMHDYIIAMICTSPQLIIAITELLREIKKPPAH